MDLTKLEEKCLEELNKPGIPGISDKKIIDVKSLFTDFFNGLTKDFINELNNQKNEKVNQTNIDEQHGGDKKKDFFLNNQKGSGGKQIPEFSKGENDPYEKKSSII